MEVSLKYAVVERERRFLLRSIPSGVVSRSSITDRYLDGTRLRLREVVGEDGHVTRKLGQKIRMGAGPAEIAHTTMYLDEAEWSALSALPARTLTKTRHRVVRDGWQLAVDEFVDGTLLAEIDDGHRGSAMVPQWLDVIAEVSADEAWTAAALADGGRGCP